MFRVGGATTDCERATAAPVLRTSVHVMTVSNRWRISFLRTLPVTVIGNSSMIADDHVLGPSGDRNVSVGIHHPDVAGIHPPAGVDRFGGLVPGCSVPEHHRVPAGSTVRLAPRGTVNPVARWTILTFRGAGRSGRRRRRVAS